MHEPKVLYSTMTTSTNNKIITTIMMTSTPLEVLCPDCGAEVDAWPGNSMMWFTGRREHYACWHVICPNCKREGFPGYYQGDENSAAALREAVRQFLMMDSRPIFRFHQQTDEENR